jgi:YD repeat-containing protein
MLLGALFVGSRFLTIRAQITSMPFYQESLAIARSSPELQSLLGQSVQEGWGVYGVVHRAYGSEFAEWTVSLKGSKGRGQLYGVANRIGPSWHYSRLLVILAGSRNSLDITPPPAKDPLLFGDREKKVLLVPLGTADQGYFSWAPSYYKAKFGLEVQILPTIPLNASVWNSTRNQLIAEKLIDLMKQALPAEARDQSSILIGVTAADMYIGSYDWNYAINYREDGRFGVVSTARLQPLLFFQKWDRALVISRLQKMLNKNVYLLCFDVPLSNDDTSAVSGGVTSPAELDYMSDQIIGAKGQWDSALNGVVPTISMVMAPAQPVAWNMEWNSKPPTDVSSEHFSANLWAGSLIQKKTDFYLGGDFPLQFVRLYASRNKESREFGPGTRDSLDISMTGEPGKYLQLVLENGVQTRFDRDATRDSGGRLAYQGHVDYLGPFSQATVFMKGFDSDLVTTDGWHYFFPYRPTAKSEDKLAVLTGFSDPQGRRFEMERNDAGDLLSIRTPAGKWLHFECDPQHRYRRIEDSEGRVVNYDYDQKGRLVRVSDSQGAAEIYRYDDQNQMQAVLDANHNVLMSITYSPEGSISSQSLRDGREFRYEYKRNAAGQVFQIQFTDPRGYQTEFSYVGKKYTQSLPHRTAEESRRATEPVPNEWWRRPKETSHVWRQKQLGFFFHELFAMRGLMGGNHFFGEFVGHVVVVRELHGVRGAALGL